MTRPDDPQDDMSPSLSAQDADRVLGERPLEDEVSGDAAGVARLLASMRTPPESDPAAEQRMIASIATEIRTAGHGEPITVLRDGGRRRRISTKAAAFAFAAVLASGTAAAAATGTLPGPVQRAVSNALSHVNINVPQHGHSSGHAGGSKHHVGSTGHGATPGAVGTAPASAQDPNAGGNAEYGLCTAQSHHSTANGAKSVAFANLQRAAANDGLTVSEYCAGASPHKVHPGAGTTTTLPPDSSTTSGPTGATGPAGATGGTHANNGKQGGHGPPASTPGNKYGNSPKSSTTTAATTPTTTAHGKGKGKGQSKKPATTHT